MIHSVSGLKRGVGDICRLVGIPLNEINAKLAAGILPDNGTWRLPTANELAALLHPFQDSSQGRVSFHIMRSMVQRILHIPPLKLVFHICQVYMHGEGL